MEKWKSIPSHKNYQASSLGRIRSIDRIIYRPRQGRMILNTLKGKIVSPGKNRRLGYHFFYSYPGPIRTYVHRAVAATFLGGWKNSEVNHKNGVLSDNRVENLEWCSAKYNQRHSVSTGLRKLILTEEDVRIIRFFYVRDARGPKGTTSILAKIFGCGRKTIRQACDGNRYSHIK